MSTEKMITVQELSEVKYGDLKSKFTELGVPKIWRAGKKKTTMINEAIEKLAQIRKFESEGLNRDEAEVEIKEIKDKKEEDAKLAIAEERAKIEEKASVKVTESKASVYSKEVLEANLRTINLNLLQAIPSHREILQLKKENIEALLKNM